MRKFSVSLRGAAAGAALFFPGQVFSQSFTIDSGGAFIGNLIMAHPNDIATIVSGGSLTAQADGVDAIAMADDNQRFENQRGGSLLQEGFKAAAIMSTGLAAEVENFGGILTTADGSHAIASIGDDALIANWGSVETWGDAAAGLVIAGVGSRSRNDGSILASGDGASGVILDGADGLLENLGAIETTGLASSGLIIGDNGDGATIINSGSIAVPLDGASQAIGVSPLADGVTLNLSSGSVIQGAINFAGANGTVNVANGTNTALQFNLPNITSLHTFGSPYAATADNLLAVVDPTGFSAHDEMLSDVTRAIADALDERFAGSRSGHGAGDAAWLKSIGGYRHAKGYGPSVGFDSLFSGAMIGVDQPARYSARAGFFGGATFGQMETATDSQAIDMQSYFAGGYASFTRAGVFFDLGAAAGIAKLDSDRRVANNLVAGGLEHAESDYLGLVFNPSLAISADIPAGGATLTPSVRLRYAALFIENHAEHGSAANLDVHGRRVDALEMRGQLAAATAPYALSGGTITHALRLGAEGYFTDSHSVDTVLLGQALSFEAGEPGVGARGFAGFESRYTADAGWQLGATTEFGYDTQGSFTASGSVKLDIPF
jgi:outer membrane autotransporter protein